MKNFPVVVKDGEHDGVHWVARACAVVGFVFTKYKGKWHILANERGEGTPDFQGMWNCPCGYLDFDETLAQACIREVYEETGFKIPNKDLRFWSYTDAITNNRQNVTFRFYAVVSQDNLDISVSAGRVLGLGGETDEVSSIGWIPLDNLDKYEWAFNHKIRIMEVFNLYVNDGTFGEPLSDFDRKCLMPLEEFIDCVNDKSIMDSDGHGYFANESVMYGINCFNHLSQKELEDMGITHVCWYNK